MKEIQTKTSLTFGLLLIKWVSMHNTPGHFCWYAHGYVCACFLNHLFSSYLFNTFINHKWQVRHYPRFWKCSGEQNSSSPSCFWHLRSLYFKNGLQDAYNVKIQRKSILISKANRGSQCTRYLRWSVYLAVRWEVPFVKYITGNVFSYSFPKDIWCFVWVFVILPLCNIKSWLRKGRVKLIKSELQFSH